MCIYLYKIPTGGFGAQEAQRLQMRRMAPKRPKPTPSRRRMRPKQPKPMPSGRRMRPKRPNPMPPCRRISPKRSNFDDSGSIWGSIFAVFRCYSARAIRLAMRSTEPLFLPAGAVLQRVRRLCKNPLRSTPTLCLFRCDWWNGSKRK